MSMKNNINWLDEIKDAIEKSLKLAELEEGGLTQNSKENLFKYAAIFAAKNRNVDADVRKQMMAFSAKRRLDDFKVEKSNKVEFELNFMLAYLDAHICVDKLEVFEADNIMRDLIENYYFSTK